jgi:hypothetical protein
MKIAEYIEVLKKLPQDATVKVQEPVCGYMDDRSDIDEDDAHAFYDEAANEYVL